MIAAVRRLPDVSDGRRSCRSRSARHDLTSSVTPDQARSTASIRSHWWLVAVVPMRDRRCTPQSLIAPVDQRPRTRPGVSLCGHESRCRRCNGPGRRGDAAAPRRAQLSRRRDPLLRLGPFGRHAPCRGRARRSRWRTPRPPTPRSRHRPVLRRRGVVARAGAEVRRRRGDRDRQLVGVADGSRRPARRQRGQPAARSPTPARGSSPTRTAPRWRRCRCSSRCTTRPGSCASIATTYQAVSGGGLAGVDELDKQAREVVDRAAELTHDGAAVAFPTPTSSPGRSPSTCCRSPARSSTTARWRPTRSRSCATRAARSSPSPTCRVSGTCVRVPVFTGHSLSHQRRVRRPDQRRPRHRDARAAPGVALSDIPTPLEAAGQDPSYVGRIRQDTSLDDGRGLVLFVSNDNLRKGAALNAVQIAEAASVAERLRPTRRARTLVRIYGQVQGMLPQRGQPLA